MVAAGEGALLLSVAGTLLCERSSGGFGTGSRAGDFAFEPAGIGSRASVERRASCAGFGAIFSGSGDTPARKGMSGCVRGAVRMPDLPVLFARAGDAIF
jgi:hypothetical protein